MSDWQERSNRRREFRQSKDGPEVLTKHPKKRMRNYCKKSKNNKHDMVEVKVIKQEFIGIKITVLWCKYCGFEKRKHSR